MARKRMIDPEFFSDEEVGAWSIPARLFYIGLWSCADDSGKFKANSRLLKAQIFPYNDDIDVDKLKDEVSKKIIFYEVNGQQYGWLKNFSKYQNICHPTPSKLPPPPNLKEFKKTSQTSMESLENISAQYNLIENNIKKDKGSYTSSRYSRLHEEVSKEDINYAKKKAHELISWLSKSKLVPKHKK